MAQLAAEGAQDPVKAERIAAAQDIPLSFLLGILRELKRGRLLNSFRGNDGGYELARRPDEITLAEIMRVVDGPLVNLRDTHLRELDYSGPTLPLEDVWMAVRASVRAVLEHVTVADLVSGRLPPVVQNRADEYQHSERSAAGHRTEHGGGRRRGASRSRAPLSAPA